MTHDDRFEVGIEFASVLAAVSKQIYDTPYAFVRENLQNAVDAIRIQAIREGINPSNESLRIDVSVDQHRVRIHDRGIGMSAEDLRDLYWTIGASGKRTVEARNAGCVGHFGIGGFANLGVCDSLVVTSQSATSSGRRTQLNRSDIEGAVGLPTVGQRPSQDASPRGTIVEGVLRSPVDVELLKQYVNQIVTHCSELIHFNGELISSNPLPKPPNSAAEAITQKWSHNNVEVSAQICEFRGATLGAYLRDISIAGRQYQIRGLLNFEGHGIDIYKQGFKLCSTAIATQIGISGHIDCDFLSPTAGRDSLDAQSQSVIANVVTALERGAVDSILKSSDLIDQHTRIFKYVRRNNLIPQMGNVRVQSAVGQWFTLKEISDRAQTGIQIYVANASSSALADVLRARGHIVVHLPSDHHKAAAIRDYLFAIGGRDLAGHVECEFVYEELSRFEKAFLSELAEAITDVYLVPQVHLVPGKLTEDIPAFVANRKHNSNETLRVFVDTRHTEVSKLARLGMTSLFRSMISAFCREYLGPALRTRSPKFFGSGAVNLDWLAAHRSEAWILLTGDIAVVNRSVRRQVVTAFDVRVIAATTTNGHAAATNPTGGQPKLVRIDGGSGFEFLDGYYLRIPNSAVDAFGDVIVDSDDRGATWAANKITLVASDGISTAFQFEIRLDRLLVDETTGSLSQGAILLSRPTQALFDGLYFPIPKELEKYLVPKGNEEIRIEVFCDWLDFAGSRAWSPSGQD